MVGKPSKKIRGTVSYKDESKTVCLLEQRNCHVYFAWDRLRGSGWSGDGVFRELISSPETYICKRGAFL